MILPPFHPPLHPPPSLRSHSLSPSLLHPFPFHLHSTSPPQQQTYRNHPCYCVTVLLRPFVFTSLPHIPVLPSRPAQKKGRFKTLPHTLSPHILSYPLSRTFVSAQMYIRSHAPAPAPSQAYFTPFRTRNAKNSSPRIRYNPNFYCTEFDTIRNAAGSNKIQVLEGSGGREFGK